jgi:hypothetical protein
VQVVDGSLAAAAAVLGGSAGLEAVTTVITAHEASAVKLLEDLKVVVEANQARRKPKVGLASVIRYCAGAFGFM